MVKRRKAMVPRAQEKEIIKTLKIFLSSKALDAFDQSTVMDQYIEEVEDVLTQHQRRVDLLYFLNVDRSK